MRRFPMPRTAAVKLDRTLPSILRDERVKGTSIAQYISIPGISTRFINLTYLTLFVPYTKTVNISGMARLPLCLTLTRRIYREREREGGRAGKKIASSGKYLRAYANIEISGVAISGIYISGVYHAVALLYANPSI